MVVTSVIFIEPPRARLGDTLIPSQVAGEEM
jgi:hypothetical protein